MTTIPTVLPPDVRPGAMPHIAMLVSPQRFIEEGPVTHRMAVGLVADGALVTLIDPLPERDPDMTQPQRVRFDRRFELPRRVRYEQRVPFWRRRDRLAKLAAQFERTLPDLIWAAGADTWDLATALGEALDRPVALDFRRKDDLRYAQRAIRSERVVAIVAPCEALAREARTVVGEQFVRIVPIGVRVDDSFTPRIAAPQVVAILAEGRDERAFSAALRAARSALERFPDLLFTVEFPANTSASVWRFARSLGLLDRITAIDGAAGSGLAMTAVRTCDVLLLPEPRGGPRAESLVALSRSVPVIAAADPMADMLADGETAVLLPAGDQHSQLWADALIAILEHPEQARAFAAEGRRRVLTHHRSSVAAAAWLVTVTDLLRGGPMRFVSAPSLDT